MKNIKDWKRQIDIKVQTLFFCCLEPNRIQKINYEVYRNHLKEIYGLISDLVSHKMKIGYKQGAKAGFQEGREQVIATILEELDLAKQNIESADDPDDPRIRIKYLEDLLLRFEGNM